MSPHKTVVAALALAACAAPQPMQMQSLAGQQTPLHEAQEQDASGSVMMQNGEPVDEASDTPIIIRVFWFFADHGP